jgi:hypothetical protein
MSTLMPTKIIAKQERYRSRVAQNLNCKARDLGNQLIEISGLQQKPATS